MLKRLLEHLQTKSRPASLGRFTIWLAFLLACFLVVENIAFAEIGARHKFPDIFSREDIRIEPRQTIGMLLVTGGNATVGGVVEKGIVVVDGNLFLAPDALVKGTVVVLGGYVKSKAGARLEKPMVTLAPLKVPVSGFLVLGLLLLGMSSLVALPMALWLTVRIASRTQPYLWLKTRLIWLERRLPAHGQPRAGSRNDIDIRIWVWLSFLGNNHCRITCTCRLPTLAGSCGVSPLPSRRGNFKPGPQDLV